MFDSNTDLGFIYMKPEHNQTDFLSRITKWVQLVFFGGMILYFGKILFVPLLFGLLVALVTYPISKKLEEKGFRRSSSIAVILILVLLLFLSLFWLLGQELYIAGRDLPLVLKRFSKLTPDVNQWIEHSFGISSANLTNWLNQITVNIGTGITNSLGGLLSSTASTIIILFIIPVYAALFLYHRGTFVRFLIYVFGVENNDKLNQVLQQSVLAYFKFVKGNFYVYCIVGILNSAALLLLGIDHAILYGMMTSFMMIIPYIGIFISASIPISAALLTKDSIWYPIAIIILIFVVIQYLESNVIYPRVVGAQLNLSTWSTLVAIIAATILWGIAGMILVTPLLSILKIVSDQVPEMKALNVLLNRSEGYQSKKKKRSV